MRKITKLFLTLALLVVGVGSAISGNHYLEIKTNSVKSNPWEWAIWYQLETPLTSGKTYVLTMDAWCSENFGVSFWPKNIAEGGQTKYTGYDISTEWSPCSCEFEANDNLNRLVWNFGSLNGTLRFDNVRLVEKGTSTNLISGGDFESGLDSHWGNDGWNKPEYNIYESENTPLRGFFKMTTNAVKDNAWEWAIWYQLDTPLTSGKTYVLSMKAKCSEAFNMPFWPYKDGGKTNYTGYNIGTEWSDCSCTFTAVDDLDYLKWCFGSLNGSVCFDDVRLVEQGTTTNLINDSGFDNDELVSNWGNDGWNSPSYGYGVEYPVVKAASVLPEVQLTKDMFKRWNSAEADATIESNNPFWNANEYGVSGTSGAVIYGNSNVGYLEYADISNYSAMKIYGTGSDLRILMNRVSDGGALTELHVTPSVEGTFVDISSYNFVHLNSIKVVNGGGETTITNITLIDPTVNPVVDYELSGDLKDGVWSSSVSTALSNPTAKVIDLSNVSGKDVMLTSANPNCVFVANAGVLSNTKNVIVDGTCANLVLTDGYPFKAPASAKATAATYSRTMPNAFGTICLPYAVSSTEAVKYYNATGIDADGALQLEALDVVSAGTPAIVYVADAGDITLTGNGILADADEKSGDVSLVGSFSAQSIDVEGAAANYYGISKNQFVQATKTLNVKPFRAYLTTSKSAGAKLRIGLPSETATAISTLTAEDATVEAIYNMAGALQNGLQKGLNIVKMSNGRTTKVFVK